MANPANTFPNANIGFVKVAPDTSGKAIGNYALEAYVDNQDGSGPVLTTLYFQAVRVWDMDDNGNVLGLDDKIDYEWKRQMLDEMRAIRIGMEHLLETGRPSFNVTQFSLVEEARKLRVDDTSTTILGEEA